MMIIPLIAIAAVFVLIAVRQMGNVRIPMWIPMFLGAMAVLVTGQIGIGEAFSSINFQVIFLLFGMFVIGEALDKSNYLLNITYNMFGKIHSADRLLLVVVFVSGILSAFLVNDALVIIATPLIMTVSSRHSIDYRPLLLALAFSVTVGSVMSPIGNPQNLLIASSGNLSNPFLQFIGYLFIPTMISLYLVYLVIKWSFRDQFRGAITVRKLERVSDPKLARLCKVSLSIFVILVMVNIVLGILGVNAGLALGYTGLIAALPIILFSSRRVEVIKDIDWSILVFFVSMFVLVESVWLTGFFQSVISEFSLNLAAPAPLFGISLVVSQFISNVPLVALYVPILEHLGAGLKAFIALAAASTIAGNLYILGAASNVIIISNAEKKYRKSLSAWEFSRIGIPLTIITALVYFVFIYVI